VRLRLVALGHNQPRWVVDGVDEYAKRFPTDWLFELIELKPEKRTSSKSTETILAELPKQTLLIALDERGEQATTRDLAAHLQSWAREAPSTTFAIGSADGLDAALKASAHHRIGLSRLTLPHGLARVLLAEQLYRAVSLLAGHPYHRD
jgi:23S rRNA (pseudouridine1915-N3)-methyltransferase